MKKRIAYPSLCLSLVLAACGGDGSLNTPGAKTAIQTALDSLNAATTPMSPSAPAPAPGTPPVQVPNMPFGQDAAGYELAFSDEFDNSFNTNLWNDHIWYEGANATKNFSVEAGSLKIWPERDATGKFFNRTIDTDGHFSQTYGYFEIEAKLPKGKGTWPAFWLMNHSTSARPEIDIMKAYAGATGWGVTGADGVPYPTVYGPAVWTDTDKQAGFTMVPTPDLSAAFHKYGFKWEPNKQTFYFDGKEVYSVNVSMSAPMYLLVDLWLGGVSGTPDQTTPTGPNNAYEVKYVKTWKFKGQTPAPAPARRRR